MELNPPFKYAATLNGRPYYKSCPILHDNQKLYFKYQHYKTTKEPWEQMRGVRVLSDNTLVFQLAGETHLSWGEYSDVLIKPAQMYFLPRGAEVSGWIDGEVDIVVAVIERGMTNKELVDLRDMKGHERFDKFEFKPLPMCPAMLNLAQSIKDYLVSGVDCSHLHQAKFAELYVVLHWFYSIADNAQLFYPMAGTISEFKDFIIDNFHITTSIDELVAKANISRSTFDRKFKDNFHTTPLKWIDERTRQAIISRASEPHVTAKDIMYDVGISNPSQFTTLCKRLCGVTPSELIRPK